MKLNSFFAAAAAVALVACNNNAPEAETTTDTPAPAETEVVDESLMVPEGANVFWVNLENGQTVSSPLYVEMGVEGMDVNPAGEIVPGTGHHHIIINKGHITKGETVPADETHIHYGGGQTSDTLKLNPGNYTLTLQFANGVHASFGEQMSASVEVVVE